MPFGGDSDHSATLAVHGLDDPHLACQEAREGTRLGLLSLGLILNLPTEVLSVAMHGARLLSVP